VHLFFPACNSPPPNTVIVKGDALRKKKKRKSSGRGGLDDELDEGTGPAPYDANEPVYCTCKRVSFGQMVACDNADCAIEWYHYGCVGLKNDTDPPDPWFCPSCRPKSEDTVAVDVEASAGAAEAEAEATTTAAATAAPGDVKAEVEAEAEQKPLPRAEENGTEVLPSLPASSSSSSTEIPLVDSDSHPT